jgi:hypothetical protein
MSAKGNSLEHVLKRTARLRLDFGGVRADELKRAARFWVGTAANKFRKGDCEKALEGVFRDPELVRSRVRALPDGEAKVLGIFKLYGGGVPGPVLVAEVLTRGLVKDPRQQRGFSYRREKDAVRELRDKLLLVSETGYSPYYHGYSYLGYDRLSYPDLFPVPHALEAAAAAAPLPWVASAPVPAPPEEGFRRSPAEVALDVWAVAQELVALGPWKTNRGGSPAKSVQNRLRKLFAAGEPDPMAPPDVEVLYYELLRGVGAIRAEGGTGAISLAAVERHLRRPAHVQCWERVRAWIDVALWQDGIGLVPDRDRYDESVRIEPRQLRAARELLAWALCRVAHGPAGWLDLATFLADLWAAAAEGISFYWSNFSWQPRFDLADMTDKLGGEAGRLRAHWMARGGAWAANALMGTLAYLGLVERGTAGGRKAGRPCFRLTAAGRAVFGAPDVQVEEPAGDSKFLTVQPNYEVVVYLDEADAGAVWPLARMARRASPPGGRAQTFALTRDSVYAALEAGLTVEAMRDFLRAHSKSGLPDNVAVSLGEWGRKREALVLRTGVALLAFPPDQAGRAPKAPRGQQVGNGCVLLPDASVRGGVRGAAIRETAAAPSTAWQIDEERRIRVREKSDAVALARLGQFAEPSGDRWQITAASVRRARERGITADQIVHWLHDHLANDLPPLVETFVRNWSGGGKVFLGPLLMLQVPAQAVEAVRTSRCFQPFLLGHIPPDWFVIRDDQRQELEGLLAELGFSAGGPYDLAETAPGRRRAAGPGAKRQKGHPRPDDEE